MSKINFEVKKEEKVDYHASGLSVDKSKS